MKTSNAFFSGLSSSFLLFIASVAFLGAETQSPLSETSLIDADNRIELAASRYVFVETQSNALAKILRQVGSTGTVSVGFTCKDGSARAGRDYVAVTGSVTFAEGQYTNWLTIQLIDTPRADGNRFAFIELFAIDSVAVLGAGTNALMIVMDDEVSPLLIPPQEDFIAAVTAGGVAHAIFTNDGIVVMSEPLKANSDLQLDGGTHAVTLSGEGMGRIFNVASNATLVSNNLTLANGYSTNGGALWNEGTAVLNGCTFSNNIAHGTDGADGAHASAEPSEPGTHGEPGRGGAVFSLGNVVISNCIFAANAAMGGRGGDGGDGFIGTNYGEVWRGANGGNGETAQGGAIYSLGPIAAVQTSFLSNWAVGGRSGQGGSGVWTNQTVFDQMIHSTCAGTNGLAAEASGGAIHATADVALSQCVMIGNAAVGGLGVASVTNSDGTQYQSGFPGGNGSSGGLARGGALLAMMTATVHESQFLWNTAQGGGGGRGANGGNGEFAALYSPNHGGAGGRGGDGGSAQGAGIHAGSELIVCHSIFQQNNAAGGPAGKGGVGGDSGGAGGDVGAGGHGGHGGPAVGGAIFAQSLGAFLSNRFEANDALGGVAGDGGMSGQRCCRYSDSAPAGNGGNGGPAEAGAVFLASANILESSDFVGNSARGGQGGTGARGTDFTGGAGFSAPGRVVGAVKRAQARTPCRRRER